MVYVSTRQRFIEECLVNGCDLDDTLFLTDLEFDDSGEPKPGSIYAIYRKPEA